MPLKILDLDYKYNDEKKDTNSLLNALRHTLYFKGFFKKHSIHVEKLSYSADGNVKWSSRCGKQSDSSSKS